MPMREPAKVSISPKAISTEWWISASGGQQKPASNSKPPYTQRLTDNINCTFFMISFLSSNTSSGFNLVAGVCCSPAKQLLKRVV